MSRYVHDIEKAAKAALDHRHLTAGAGGARGAGASPGVLPTGNWQVGVRRGVAGSTTWPNVGVGALVE